MDTDTREVEAQTVGSAAELFEELQRVSVLTIDIPIGLTDGPPWACDREARRLLGPRASSVFPAPVRQALSATTYEEACDLSEAACGKRLSKQAHAILPRIRDVDEQIRLLPASQLQVREVHPEICFYFWAGGRPMTLAKKDSGGLAERLALVEAAFPGAYGDIRSSFRRGEVANDDIVDSLAALRTAERLLTSQAVSVPRLPPTDRYGLRMEMLA